MFEAGEIALLTNPYIEDQALLSEEEQQSKA
jgi:hypothetical protein